MACSTTWDAISGLSVMSSAMASVLHTAHWFHGLNFNLRSPYGDKFGYEGWNGNYDLVKLNLHSPEVKDHLFQAIRQWVHDFDIDGLRLDVADSLDKQFLHELSVFCHGLRPDFWLMGEVVHGDYNAWANPDMLDSVTNYECYKGLYSSLVDKNYFEIAYSLKRQFGPSGLYRDLKLYNFVDNHDVDRVASSLKNAKHLYPLYCLLFTMPGIPSVYYGSEWGLQARRTSKDDRALRPCLDLKALLANSPQPELPDAIAHLARVRLWNGRPAIRRLQRVVRCSRTICLFSKCGSRNRYRSAQCSLDRCIPGYSCFAATG